MAQQGDRNAARVSKSPISDVVIYAAPRHPREISHCGFLQQIRSTSRRSDLYISYDIHNTYILHDITREIQHTYGRPADDLRELPDRAPLLWPLLVPWRRRGTVDTNETMTLV